MFLVLISQMQVLKVEVLAVGYEPFTPQGEGLGFELSPHYWSLNHGQDLP